MANKWRTTIADADWVFVRYSINPSDVLTETLVRKVTGIDKSVLAALITAQKAITTVTDPAVDNQKYEGIWTVKTLDPNPDEQGNTTGSADIVQVLSKGSYTYARPDNLSLVRSRAYSFEQNENAWMYYERFKNEETYKWSNLTKAGLIAVWDNIRQILTPDNPTNYAYPIWLYLTTKTTHLYSIVRWEYTYYGTSYVKYFMPVIISSGSEYKFNNWVEISIPTISECWYEQNSDGTYNLYRTLKTTNEPAIMRTRALQYAGMTLVQGLPILDDTVLTISGLQNETEVVYENARFRIGGDTYRVLGDSTAVDGTVTVDVNPAVTLATETLCDDNMNNVQCFWDAL